MYEYLLLYRKKGSKSYNIINREAEDKYDFLETIDKDILRNYEWTVYSVDWSESKKEIMSSGDIDYLMHGNT